MLIRSAGVTSAQVSVELPDTALPVDQTAVVEGRVSAVYSYGKAVKGTADLKLKMYQWGCSGTAEVQPRLLAVSHRPFPTVHYIDWYSS